MAGPCCPLPGVLFSLADVFPVLLELPLVAAHWPSAWPAPLQAGVPSPMCVFQGRALSELFWSDRAGRGADSELPQALAGGVGGGRLEVNMSLFGRF